VQIHLRIAALASLLAVSTFPAFGSIIDVVFYDNHFGTLNDATGAYTEVGTLPVGASAGIASMNGLLYLEDMGSALYTVDPLTGISTRVGATGLTTVSGAFAGDSDGLFEVDYSSNLYSINPTTGAAQLVGATGLTANNGRFDTSLSADGTSLYYTAGGPGAYDELYAIDITTGVATDLGSTGVTGIAGSALVGSELELFQYGQTTNYIYSAPVGSTDFVQDTKLAAQIIDGGASLTPPPASDVQADGVPEPGSAVLLLGGILALAWRRGGARRTFIAPLKK
jgi:hypothetical protein